MLALEKVTDIELAEDGQEALDIVQKTMSAMTEPLSLTETLSTPTDSSNEPSPSEPFDMIFMDIQMPNLDGIQSTKKIRELGYNAPIVALTAFTDETNRANCEEAGMNDFLPKPLKRTALKRMIGKFTPIEEVHESDETKGKHRSGAEQPGQSSP